MKTKRIVVCASLVCLSFLLFSGCKGKTKSETVDPAVLTPEQLVQNGSYLVALGGCNDCHSPKRMGPNGPEVNPDLILSGFQSSATLPVVEKNAIKNGWALLTLDLNAAAGPWGVSFAANLTSDQTGIGNWPEENFIRALKEGKFKGIEGSRSLLPPMPWQNFNQIKTEDIKAIFAYLKSTKPIINVVPAAIEPANIK
jgi:mono/diheme cytochrome c family protein